MKLLTLLPPTLGLKDSANGSNWPFYAFYCSNHPFAAALAAQEVREARYKAPRMVPGLLAGAALAGALVALNVPLALFYAPIVIVLLGTLSAKLLTNRRKVEFIGQSVECVVRRDKYATLLGTALDEASKQLTRYGQFKGVPQEDIRAELVKAIPAAEEWAKDNAELIGKALA